MLALSTWEATRCPMCGGDRGECWDPKTDGRWHVPPPKRCLRTSAISFARKGYQENPFPEALMFRAELRG